MSARQSREVGEAVAYLLYTQCKPAVAAKRYGVAVSSVRRAMIRLGIKSNPVGRPATKGK